MDHDRLNYWEYMHSPLWREQRAAALERWDYRCVMCRSSDDLEVHHNTYERLGHERPTDLVVLCDRCHEKYHFRLPRIVRGEGGSGDSGLAFDPSGDWAFVRHHHYNGIDGEQMDLDLFGLVG